MTQAGVVESGAPRVSVVMRCYRQATHLPEAVASVVAQGYQDWEIVIVDDGSPDDTAAVARDLARRHAGRRIRLVQQENQGPPRALNAGVAAAAGGLVLVLDADDAIHPVFLERAVAALDADPGADVVFTDVVLFGAEAKVWKMGPFELPALKTLNRLCCTSLYRRRLWEEAGGYATNMELGYEDWDFWIGVAERGHRAIHLRQPLFFYRMHGAAETTNSTAMRFHQELTAQVILNHPRAYGPEAVEVARRFLAARPLPTRAQLAAAARAAAAAGGGPPPEPTPPGLAERGPAVLPGPAEARRPSDEEARAALEGPPIPIYPRPARARIEHVAGDPAVSVVIPCWRQAEYLPMAVGSVALQSFQDWELLVVDDGSPDDTAAVATRLFANLPGRRCRLIRQANAGLSAARNAGIAAARGRYVLPLDSDDALDAAFLERTVRRLEVGDVDIVATDGVMFGARTDYMAVRLDLYWANVHNANCLNYCSLYHRDVWERVGGYNVNMTRSYEDWDFWVGCRAAGFAVGHVGEPLFFYRTKEASMATMAAQHDVQNRARIILNHPGLYPERVQAAARAVLERDPLPPYRGPAT